MALLAVGFEDGLKRDTIDFAFDCRHAARWELRTGVLWQNQKRPGVALLARRWPEEFRCETNLRSGLGHFA